MIDKEDSFANLKASTGEAGQQGLSSGTKTFLQRRGTGTGQQAHGKMLNITNTREMEIKTIVRYHLTPVRMSVIKWTRNNTR